MALVRAGQVSPSAEAVADQAGVGLRSVFRHFNDLESLYREIGAAVAAQVRPLIEAPFAGQHWRDQLDELLARKIQVFEDVMMFYIAGAVHQHTSAFARADHEQAVAMEHKALRKLLPDTLRQDRDLVAALELTVSFDSWIRLRRTQGLSLKRSREVTRRLIEALLPPDSTRVC